VVAELQRRHRKTELAGDGGREEGSSAWFLDIVAAVTGKSRSEVHLGSRVSDLGFDSLAFNELAEAVEGAGISVPEQVDFMAARDVAGLLALVSKGRGGALPAAKGKRARDLGEVLGDDDLQIPESVSRLGKRGLGLAQRLFYQRVLDTKVTGELHIPRHTHFLVAANHCSHLDMGVIKVALGEAGRDLTSLAAADYFFSNRWRRAYFANFTNLVPMERTGSIRKSMDVAERVLRRGRSMVVFPEGTRSLTGDMAEFLPSLGYLALRAETGILPAYVAGSYDALPKGSALPKQRELEVRFGPFLTHDFLKTLTEGLSHQEAWRLVAALTQRLVESLRDGKSVRIDRAAIRAAWDGHALGAIQAAPRAARPRLPGDAPRTVRLLPESDR
jgi:long-chain acyl-CoA synthetase